MQLCLQFVRTFPACLKSAGQASTKLQQVLKAFIASGNKNVLAFATELAISVPKGLSQPRMTRVSLQSLILFIRSRSDATTVVSLMPPAKICPPD